ncbi:MAG TPA: hypothetical protein DF292_09325 [Firmicutes bacterium]|nr:hypothetical protein [Bacillota bacterium]HBL51002.1 hypothetical protein [Bacillota bacterium]HCT37214.1 hypothetical protein [Bacillota bacterium]
MAGRYAAAAMPASRHQAQPQAQAGAGGRRRKPGTEVVASKRGRRPGGRISSSWGCSEIWDSPFNSVPGRGIDGALRCGATPGSWAWARFAKGGEAGRFGEVGAEKWAMTKSRAADQRKPKSAMTKKE